MTEQEAIKKLNMLDEALNFQRHDADECSQALQMAIRSLNAWEEVREELLQLTSCSGHKDHENNCGGCGGCVECKLEDAYHVAIGIINQRLADIEE